MDTPYSAPPVGRQGNRRSTGKGRLSQPLYRKNKNLLERSKYGRYSEWGDQGVGKGALSSVPCHARLYNNKSIQQIKSTMYQFQKFNGEEWNTIKVWHCLATMVEYVNNYHQIEIGYKRTHYHLNRYGSYEFNMRSGKFQHRIVKPNSVQNAQASVASKAPSTDEP
jgi:hypothetical protein